MQKITLRRKHKYFKQKTVNEKITKTLTILKPYKDIIIFMVALLVANYFWKFTVMGDEEGGPVSWFGIDITWPFSVLATHISYVASWWICLFRDTAHWIAPNTILFDSGSAVIIVWSCTALKQSFIWLCIMLAASGLWKRKLWFIPFGWLCIYVFNIFRIAAIALIIEHHPDLFDLMHTYIFKYLFYGFLFALWVWWTEKLGKPAKKAVAAEENDKEINTQIQDKTKS